VLAGQLVLNARLGFSALVTLRAAMRLGHGWRIAGRKALFERFGKVRLNFVVSRKCTFLCHGELPALVMTG
jgi:hypothetical protein